MMLIIVVLSSQIPKVKTNWSEKNRHYNFFGHLLYAIEKKSLFIIINNKIFLIVYKDDQRNYNVW